MSIIRVVVDHLAEMHPVGCFAPAGHARCRTMQGSDSRSPDRRRRRRSGEGREGYPRTGGIGSVSRLGASPMNRPAKELFCSAPVE